MMTDPTTTTTTTITTTTTTTRRVILHLLLVVVVLVVTTLTQVTMAQEEGQTDGRGMAQGSHGGGGSEIYNPCVSSSHPGVPMSDIRVEDIPANFTIKTNCMPQIIEELCKNNRMDEDSNPHGTVLARGLPPCLGPNCSIDCLYFTFCNDINMTQQTQSVPQREQGYLPQRLNYYPGCDRYISNMNHTAIAEKGRSCKRQLMCTCGLCCEGLNRDMVISTMLRRTYNDFQKHLQIQNKFIRPKRPLDRSQGRLSRLRIPGYRIDVG